MNEGKQKRKARSMKEDKAERVRQWAVWYRWLGTQVGRYVDGQTRHVKCVSCSCTHLAVRGQVGHVLVDLEPGIR
eukprot:6214734-Pleurochrysis_carterae.AAC.2